MKTIDIKSLLIACLLAVVIIACSKPSKMQEVTTKNPAPTISEKPLTPEEKIVGTYVKWDGNGIKQTFKFSRNGRFEYTSRPAFSPVVSISGSGGIWKLSDGEVVFRYDKQIADKFFKIEADGSLTIVAELVNGVREPMGKMQTTFRKR